MVEWPTPLPPQPRRRLLASCGLTYAAFASANALPAVSLVQIAAAFDLNDAQSGLIFAVGAAVNLIMLPLFGLLAERLGKRGLLAMGLFLLTMALGVFCAARSYAFLLAGAAILGVASAIIEALVSPLITDLYPQRTAPAMNLVHACYQIGLVATAIVAGVYLAHRGPWTHALWPVMLVTVLLATAFAVLRFPPPMVPEAPHGVLGLLRQVPFWLCTVGMAAAGGVEAGVINWVSSFLQRQFDLTAGGGWLAERLALADPAPLIGGIGVALFAAPMVVGRGCYGSIAERLGYLRTLLLSSVISIVGLIGLGFASTATAAVVWLSIVGLALSGMWPTILAYASATIQASPPTLFSLLAMAGLVGVGGCSWGIGRLADAYGLQAGLTALVVPMLAGLAALAMLPRRTGYAGDGQRVIAGAARRGS